MKIEGNNVEMEFDIDAQKIDLMHPILKPEKWTLLKAFDLFSIRFFCISFQSFFDKAPYGFRSGWNTIFISVIIYALKEVFFNSEQYPRFVSSHNG